MKVKVKVKHVKVAIKEIVVNLDDEVKELMIELNFLPSRFNIDEIDQGSMRIESGGTVELPQ
jgi:hypothetical protein